MEDFLSIDNFIVVFDVLYNYCKKNFKITITQQEVKKPMYKIMMKLYETSKEYNRIKTQGNKILIKKMIEIIKKKHTNNVFEEESYNHTFDDPLIRNDTEIIDYNIPLLENIKSVHEPNKIERDIELQIEPSTEPKLLYSNVLENPKNKSLEIDETEAPKQLSEELIIPIPKEFKNIYKHMYNHPIVVTYLTIDSRDRNNDLYTSNNYKLALDQTYDNVVSVELITSEIPNTEYTINENNNILHFEESANTILEVGITFGNYTADILATQLEEQMNLLNGSTYNVSVVDNKFIITSDKTGGSGLFNIKLDGGLKSYGPYQNRQVYKENSIGEILGFNKNDLPDSGITSIFTAEFDNKLDISDKRYIYLYITDCDNIHSLYEDYDSNKFALIFLDVDKGNTKYYKKGKTNQQDDEKYNADLYGLRHDCYKKIFDPPKSIDGFIIQFKDYYGNPFNFNGFENSLILKIEMLNIRKNIEISV